jgi:NAD(P)-dependent dehydrogenase (short-subunit alcohol dehydrogenase family)
MWLSDDSSPCFGGASLMFEDLSKKTALVTGASGGLGAHFSRVLARRGVHIVLAARRAAALSDVVADITAAGGHASAVELDVSSADSVRALERALGEVDILVNNAGVVRGGPALEQSESDWDIVMDTNLKGMFLVAQACGRTMRAHGRGGSIINVASILGLRQTNQVLPYAVSKAGVIQLTKSLALELARFGIRVNALAPGYLDTDLNRDFLASDSGSALVKRIPQRRAGQLGELDGPLLLLASDASSYMTGSVLAVDGGHLVSGL